jgi:hypothetical protein
MVLGVVLVREGKERVYEVGLYTTDGGKGSFMDSIYVILDICTKIQIFE